MLNIDEKIKINESLSSLSIIKAKAFLLKSSSSYSQSESSSSSARRRLTKSTVTSVGQMVSLSQTSLMFGGKGAMFWKGSTEGKAADP